MTQKTPGEQPNVGVRPINGAGGCVLARHGDGQCSDQVRAVRK